MPAKKALAHCLSYQGKEPRAIESKAGYWQQILGIHGDEEGAGQILLGRQ
jgi:hypothetical protein